jgi:hypothetical protein
MLTTGASPSTVTSPPPPRVLVEIPFSDHHDPRHGVQQNRRELLKPPLPLDLAAGDFPRRNMVVPFLFPFCLEPRTPNLEEMKAQGAICKALDSNE